MDPRALHRFRRNRGAVVGLALVVAIVVFSFAAPLLSSHSPYTPDFAHGRGPFGTPGAPSSLHWLGTDTVFRDVLVRLAHGGRLSLEVAFVATAIAVTLGVAVGITAGYFKDTRVRLDAVGDTIAGSLAAAGLIALAARHPVFAGRALAASAWLFALAAVLRLFAAAAGLVAARRPSMIDAVDAIAGAAALARVAQHRAAAFADPRAVTVVVAAAVALAAARALRPASLLPHPRVDVDDAAMRAVDVLLAFPFLLLVMALSAAIDRTSETTIFVVLGLTAWTGTARVIRGKTLQLRQLEFVVAARALGQSTPRILLRHILPNVIGVAIVLATNSVAGMIVAEAALSFLGLSLPPPTASWGRMLDEGRTYYAAAPWLLVAPGAVILAAVLGFNLLGEGLRDAFDPREAR